MILNMNMQFLYLNIYNSPYIYNVKEINQLIKRNDAARFEDNIFGKR